MQLCYIFKYEIAHSKEKGVEYRQNREIISARGCNSSREILGIGFSSKREELDFTFETICISPISTSFDNSRSFPLPPTFPARIESL